MVKCIGLGYLCIGLGYLCIGLGYLCIGLGYLLVRHSIYVIYILYFIEQAIDK